MLTMLRYEEELQTAKETVCEGMMHALPAVNVNFHFSHFLRQGGLFFYGTEPICEKIHFAVNTLSPEGVNLHINYLFLLYN